ncbi:MULTISPECIES: hypothetical protein [unclassified Mannheimia]|uniref:hypothetical protein n=1 Tax=unclassified Mannheimia TaxID=2645054 RepID=UPI00359D2A4C
MVTSSGLIVEMAVQFRKEFVNLPLQDQLAITEFAQHLMIFGFENLEGKNKSSDNVPTNDPKWREKVSYAQKHHLWHYHIGIKQYDKTKAFGERTSEYVLHYQKLGNVIRLVDYSSHPPFKLPSEIYLQN